MAKHPESRDVAKRPEPRDEAKHPGLRDAVFGAAIGDALGVPFEFQARDAFTCTDMVGYGSHHMPAGTFSDDTSMMLALCDSIRACGGAVDVVDIRERFCAWIRDGAYTPDGIVFDVGGTVGDALSRGYGLDGERSNGNGSLMRTVPLAFVDVDDDTIRAVSSITHAHPLSCEACVIYVHIARRLAAGEVPDQAIIQETPAAGPYAFLADVIGWKRDQVSSGGFVKDTLAASLWCLTHTGSYRECVLAAVNLGSDTDTTACVAGGLAGIVYGIGAIPASWMKKLRGVEVIEACLF